MGDLGRSGRSVEVTLGEDDHISGELLPTCQSDLMAGPDVEDIDGHVAVLDDGHPLGQGRKDSLESPVKVLTLDGPRGEAGLVAQEADMIGQPCALEPIRALAEDPLGQAWSGNDRSGAGHRFVGKDRDILRNAVHPEQW